MTEAVISLPRLTKAQSSIAADTRRFVVVTCGRRFGKTVLGARLAVQAALRGLPVGWFAPIYKYASEVFDELARRLEGVSTRISRADKRIALATGGHIDVWSLDRPNAGRGRKYGLAVLDEAAIVRDLFSAWNYSIRPTLSDLGGRAFFMSTPNGMNYFYSLHQRGLSGESNWAAYSFPTGANPHIKPEEIEEARRGLPERVFRQEYLAEFVSDGNYFTGVDECATIVAPDEPANHAGHFVSIGVDWALSHDYTSITCLCRNCGRVVDWDRFNRIDFIRQRDRLAQMWRKWQARIIVPENNSIGAPNIEHLVKEGLPVWYDARAKRGGFTTTATSKAQIMQALALALEQKSIAVPIEYRGELAAYEAVFGGVSPRFGAPEGQHDDRVMSLALAYFGAAQPAAIFV